MSIFESHHPAQLLLRLAYLLLDWVAESSIFAGNHSKLAAAFKKQEVLSIAIMPAGKMITIRLQLDARRFSIGSNNSNPTTACPTGLVRSRPLPLQHLEDSLVHGLRGGQSTFQEATVLRPDFSGGQKHFPTPDVGKLRWGAIGGMASRPSIAVCFDGRQWILHPAV